RRCRAITEQSWEGRHRAPRQSLRPTPCYNPRGAALSVPNPSGLHLTEFPIRPLGCSTARDVASLRLSTDMTTTAIDSSVRCTGPWTTPNCSPRSNERKPCDVVSADDLPTDCGRVVVKSTGRDDCLIIWLTTRWRSRISGRLLGIEGACVPVERVRT